MDEGGSPVMLMWKWCHYFSGRSPDLLFVKNPYCSRIGTVLINICEEFLPPLSSSTKRTPPPLVWYELLEQGSTKTLIISAIGKVKFSNR